MRLRLSLLLIPALFFILLPLQGQSASGEEAREELYQNAEEGQWYSGADVKDIDALYKQAMEAGSEKAVMAAAVNRFYRDRAMKEESVRKLCQQIAPIAARWEKGEADADQLYHLAQYYGLSWCKERDLKKAQRRLAQSAEAGNAKAQYFMGRMIRDTLKKGACDWFRKAADAGLPQAIAALGSCYLLGHEVPKDAEKGMEYINRALGSQNINALFHVALCYLEGAEGLPRNTEEARRILEELVTREYEPAKSVLDNSALFRR